MKKIKLDRPETWRGHYCSFSKIHRGQVVRPPFNVCSGRAASLFEMIATMTRIAGPYIDVEISSSFVRVEEINGKADVQKSVLQRKDIPLSGILGGMYEVMSE